MTAALVIIDVQNDFCASDGAVATSGGDVTHVQAAVRRISALLEVARESDVQRVFVRVVHNDWLDAGAWGDRHRGTPGRSGGRKAVEGTWGADFFEVSPLDGEPVITKTRYSAFSATPLRQVLHGLGVDEVYLAGTQTDVCILTTAIDAVQEGFRVTVISDCVASPRLALHEAALEIVRLRAGRVMASEDVIADLVPASPGAGRDTSDERNIKT